jgi:long-subunit fatty acid transport protein
LAAIAPAISVAAPLPDIASEIPLPNLTGNEARPMGMGGAGLALSEDASAVFWNPAGLAQIRRIELSASLTHDRSEFSGNVDGVSSSASTRSTNLGSAHLVYPFPTYRGSLVLALGSNQFRNYDQELEISSTNGPGDLTDILSEEGKLTGWSAALAIEASPRLYLGGALFLHDGEDDISVRQITEDVNDEDPEIATLDDIIETSADISGYSGNIGVLYRVTPNVRVGAAVRTAMTVEFSGSQVIDELTIFDDGDEVSDVSETFFEDQFSFPASFGVGGAATAAGLTVALDARYTDWSQVSFEGSPLANSALSDQYDDKGSWNVGAEYLIGASPLRVRAGFFYDPVPFRLLYAPAGGRETEVAVDSERKFVTFGAGVLVDTVLMIDLAVQTGSYTRASEVYSEERELTRVYLSTAYRF